MRDVALRAGGGARPCRCGGDGAVQQADSHAGRSGRSERGVGLYRRERARTETNLRAQQGPRSRTPRGEPVQEMVATKGGAELAVAPEPAQLRWSVPFRFVARAR